MLKQVGSRVTLAGAVICLLAGCSTLDVAPEQAGGSPRPNILLIVADDLGFSDIGAFGSEVPTPNLDRLAFSGTRLVQFTNTAKCFPSRASLLTGLYAGQVNRAERARTPMVGGVTIAESLEAAGYTTLMVGKHHGVTHPMDRGFHRYSGLRDGAANHFNPGTAARPGEPEPARKAEAGRWWCFERDCQQGYSPDAPGFYTTDAFTGWAIEYLEEASGEQPFFLYLAYTAPHDPLQAPEADIAVFRGDYDAGYGKTAEARYNRQVGLGIVDPSWPLLTPDWRDWDDLTDAERSDQAARMEVYAAMIASLDRNVGRLVATLEARGELDNTLVIFTSDNGASAERVYDSAAPGQEIGAEHPIGTVGRWASLGPDWAGVANTPFRYFKNDSFNGGVVAPTFVRWPSGGVPQGRILDAASHLIDLHPTLLGVLGLNYDADLGPGDAAPALPGADLSGMLLSGHATVRTRPIFNRWGDGRMVILGKWKLVSRSEGQGPEAGAWQLYDLSADRAETRDISREHPSVVEELSELYDDWLKSGAAGEVP